MIGIAVSMYRPTTFFTYKILFSLLKLLGWQNALGISHINVGALGFEPRVIRSQSEHVSRYTMLRYNKANTIRNASINKGHVPRATLSPTYSMIFSKNSTCASMSGIKNTTEATSI